MRRRGRIRCHRSPEPCAIAAAALVLLGPWASAGAFEIETGVPDLALRFDTNVRYNLGVRTGPVDTRIGANPAFTSGAYSFGQGSVTTNRLDLVPELDLAYADRYGARLTAAGWYDYAYQRGTARRSPALVEAGVPGSYVGDRYSDYTLERYRGPWGEPLDAFAFARFELGGVPLAVKAGRHAVYWGESLLLSGALHGISYSQMPIDLQKGFATPGVEARELFRPIANISAQAQLAPTLSLAGQYFFEWQSFLYPEGGTFLGPADFAFNGPDGVPRTMNGTLVYLANAGVSAPRQVGDWGVAARWAPAALDATFGFYYRRYTDKLASLLLSPNPGGVGPLSPAIGSPYHYRQYYGEGIDLFALSVAKQLLGVSVAGELSYRRGTPLLAQTLAFVVPPAPPLAPVLFPHGAPQLKGNTYQARGDTVHAVVNAVGVLARTPAFDAASWAIEATYSRWLTVRDNPDMFYGEGYGVCRSDPTLAGAGLARTRNDGCATRDYVGVGASFTPTWYRAFSGVDLYAPLTVSWTVRGNSAVTLGGNEGSGTYAAGVAADVLNSYRFDLKYVDYFGSTYGTDSMVTSANGQLALLKGRGSVNLTARATF